MRGNKIMRLDDDFWLQLLIALGFGTLGGFAKYLDYRNKAKKSNPKFNEKFFSGLLFTTLVLGMISAIVVVFFILELVPTTSPKMMVVYSVLAGAIGFAGLQIVWEIIVKNIAQKHYGVEIREVEIDNDEAEAHNAPKRKRK